MPREDQHRQKAGLNEAFAERLDASDATCENWAVVAAFYSALHHIQSYFAKHSVEAKSHEERFDQIKKDEKLRPALPSYKYLYTLSLTARYYCSGLPVEAYSKEAKPRLAAVKKQVDLALKATTK